MCENNHSCNGVDCNNIGYINHNFVPNITINIFDPDLDDDRRIDADTAIFSKTDWVARYNINIILIQDIRQQQELFDNDWGDMIYELICKALCDNLAQESEYV